MLIVDEAENLVPLGFEMRRNADELKVALNWLLEKQSDSDTLDVERHPLLRFLGAPAPLSFGY